MNELLINIGVVGTVSAGKSTFLNALFAEYFSTTHNRRTTMLPQIYKMTGTGEVDRTEYIRQSNMVTSMELVDLTENGQPLTLDMITEIEYNVRSIDLVDLVGLKPDVFLRIFDIPGLNDSRTKDVYFEYLQKKFPEFDQIIWIIDVTSAINRSDEMEIFNQIIGNIRTNRDRGIETKLIVLINKCDDMYLRNGSFVLGSDVNEMFDQAKKLIDSQIQSIYPHMSYQMIPISCENAYIYRMYSHNPEVMLDIKYLDKLGYNEFGKTKWNQMEEKEKREMVQKIFLENTAIMGIERSGYLAFVDCVKNICTPYDQSIYLSNHIKYDLDKFSQDVENHDYSHTMDTLFEQCKTFDQRIHQIEQMYEKEFDPTDVRNKYVEVYCQLFALYNQYLEKCITDNDKLTSENFKGHYEIREDLKKMKELERLIGRDESYYDILCERFDSIQKSIWSHHLRSINNTTLFPEQIRHFELLAKDNYPNLHKVIVDSLVPTISKMDPNLRVIMMEEVRARYSIDLKTMTDFAFRVIDSIYHKMISQLYDDLPNENLANDDQSTHTDLLMRLQFWEGILIRSTNIYSIHIFNLKKILNKVLYGNEIRCVNSNHITSINTDLEKYIYQFLKTYDDNIHTIDEIIDFLSKDKSDKNNHIDLLKFAKY